MRRLFLMLMVFTLCLSGCADDPIPPEGEPWDLETISPRDLGCFLGQNETERSQYALLEGQEWEMPVACLRGKEQGPVVYVVGGIHGDETAGWYAGTLMKQVEIRAGTVYILSPANRYGAEQVQRTTKSDRDINRRFPGDPAGWDAERIAAAIYEDIRDKQPDLLLDLHEAHPKQGGRDALGNSIIVESVELVGDLVMDILLASEAGESFTHAISLYSSPPEGSINRTVTRELGIPSVTCETLRTEPMLCRVTDHLTLIEYILEWYGML